MRDNPSGFTDTTRAICAESNAAMGEPPCRKLPDLVQPCQHITPCVDCLRAERDQLQSEIDAAPAWSAAVSVKQERIDGINRTLEADHGQ